MLAGIVYLALISTNGIPIIAHYQLRALLPPNAPAFVPGDQVRVAGQVEGVLTKVKRTNSGQLVTFTLAPAAEPVGGDVRLTMRPSSAAGGEYIDVTRGDFAARPLASGSLLPPSSAERTEDLLAVVQGFDHAALRELSSSTQLVGFGLAGRGGALNAAFTGLGETFATTAGILRSATPSQDLSTLTAGADRTAVGLAGLAREDAGRLTHAAASFFTALSDSRPAIAGTLSELRPTEDQALITLPAVDPLLAHATLLARRLTPAVAELRRALPPVNALLAQGGVLSTQVPPLVAAAQPSLHALGRVLEALPAVAAMLGTAAGPLGPLAAYMAQYGPELDAGFAAFDAGTTYRPPLGVAKGAPATGAMLIFTCANGVNDAPAPGRRVWSDSSKRPCR
jgi:ABC-type transporter Mla subunit MlaD